MREPVGAATSARAVAEPPQHGNPRAPRWSGQALDLTKRANHVGSADVAQRLLARLRAATAGLRADPAVLVVSGVALALLAAHLAGGRARLQHLAQDRLVGDGAP